MPRYPKGMEVHTRPGPYHSGRATKSEMEWTLNKLLKGAGAGANPTEIGTPQPAWELLDSYEDTNIGTAFDYDSGVLGTIYNLYLIILQAQDFAGTGINPLFIRINNDATSNYEWTMIDTTGVGSQVTGQPRGLIAEMRLSENVSVMALIRGGNKAFNPARDYPTFGTFGGNSGSVSLRGSLMVDYADVNQIRIYSLNPAATGRLKIYGLNL